MTKHGLKNITKSLLYFCLIYMLVVVNTIDCKAETVQAVSTYSYDEMCQDIMELSALYPDLITYGSIGFTALGRNIPYVTLGNTNATHNILIQSSIHGREYLATQMTMKMIEYYAENSATFATILTNTCFYIVPMSNPDGVMIAQLGANSTIHPDTQNFINSINKSTLWKANAMGVDLNRNFDVGWQNLEPRTLTPNFMDFKGYAPVSENESKGLIALASARNYDAFISYHMRGNIIYYDELGNTPENSAASLRLATTIGAYNGYSLHNLKQGIGPTVQKGGFNDYVQLQFNKPGVTVELGTVLPPAGQVQIGSIFEANKNTWVAVAPLYY